MCQCTEYQSESMKNVCCCALNNIPTASPTAPSNLRQLLSSNTPTNATITWDSVDNAVSYTVRSTSLQSPATGIVEESYTLTGLELVTDYTVTVTATNECGVESPPSQDITIRIDIQGMILYVYNFVWTMHVFLYSSSRSNISCSSD